VILVDTGPLVALFDQRDPDHGPARDALAGVRERLVTTGPVLTEAFRLLDPASRGAAALREFIAAAEALRTTRVLTLDRGDFATYRARIDRTWRRFALVASR
jgi:predicted nucleic acid-binding protein